jgi:hypothetical protein
MLATAALVTMVVTFEQAPQQGTSLVPTAEEQERINVRIRAERERKEEHARAVLRVSLTAPSVVTRGQPVRIRYEIVSSSSEPAEVGTGSFPRLRVEALQRDGTWIEVWDWHKSQQEPGGLPVYFDLALRIHRVTRDAPYRYEVQWKQLDNNRLPVRPGRYRAVSPERTHPELPLAAPVVFDIAE